MLNMQQLKHDQMGTKRQIVLKKAVGAKRSFNEIVLFNLHVMHDASD